jgi:Flp pilus assembly protein TadD/predicted  nucleic acid-binding Zn-ribbon protein
LLLAAATVPISALPVRAQDAALPASGQFDPSDVYFQGYLAVRAAEQMEAQGDFMGAADKLAQAQKLFDGVRMYYPEWKKEMVSGRAEKTVEVLKSIQPKADEQRRAKEGVLAELEGGVKTPGRIAGTAPAVPGVLDADPLATRRLAEAEVEVQRLRNVIRQAAGSEGMRNASRVGDLERQRDSLGAQLKAAETNADSLRARLATSPMENEFKALNKRIEGLENEREAMARALAQSRSAESDARTRIATLEADLTNMRKEADGLRQQQANLDRDLKKERNVANEVVIGQRRQLDALEKALKGRTDELHKANEQIAGLELQLKQSNEANDAIRTERDTLLTERDQMAALLKLNEAGRINQLIEQNMGLAKELREANEKVERLNVDGNAAKDDVIDALRDLAVAKSKINELHQEKRDQTKRIAELENRLKGEQAALASGEASADPAEVEVLKDIIKRQLKVQERRRQARDLLVQAAKDLGTKDERLQSAVELFDAQELQLSPEEQKLLADRNVDGEFTSPFARDRATVGRATTELNREMESYDRAATKAFAADRYYPAKELFQMIVESNPGDTSALCKLGVVQLRLEDAPAASDAFRRAVELDNNNPYAHRMLGFTLMSMEDFAGAEEMVKRSVELAPEDAKSQILLGAIFQRNGNLSGAETHYKAAIEADPMLTEPYINLAFLCARAKRIDEARNYYNLGLERGAAPDVRLEKLLRREP